MFGYIYIWQVSFNHQTTTPQVCQSHAQGKSENSGQKDSPNGLWLWTCFNHLQLCWYHQCHSVCQQLGSLPWLHVGIFSCSAVFKFKLQLFVHIQWYTIHIILVDFYYCSTWLNFKVIFMHMTSEYHLLVYWKKYDTN